MSQKKTLSSELNKIQFLAGLNEGFAIQEDEENERQKATTDEIQDEDKIVSQEKELDNELKVIEKSTSDYLKTKESSVLGLSQKISMLVGSGKGYLAILEKLIEIPFYEKAAKYKLAKAIGTPEEDKIRKQIFKEVKQELALADFKDVTTIEQYLRNAAWNIKEKENELKTDVIQKINVSGDEGEEFSDVLKAKAIEMKKDTVDDGILLFLQQKLEKLKRDGYPTATGDEKAIISHNLNAKPNEVKLTPLGFWQIQFLSRVVASQPQNELESILFGGNKYVSHAEKILKDFYQNALHKPIAILTGRKFNVNPNDHEFQIMKDAAWDKIRDGLTGGKFDARKKNFGAWAFSVARNSVIDNIKAITNLEFSNTADVYEGILTNEINTLEFKEDMDDKIPKEYLESVKQDKISGLFIYKFKNPESLFSFFNDVISEKGFFPKYWLLNLSKSSKQKLKNVGGIKSVKKFADFYQDEQGEEEYDNYTEKASGEERDVIFKELNKLYRDTAGLSMSMNKAGEISELREILDKEGNRKYSEEQINEAFQRDLGKALYFYQANYTVNTPMWIQKPPMEVVNAFKAYASENGIPENEISKIDNVNINSFVVNPIFYQGMDISKDLLKFSYNGKEYDLGDYVSYKERSAIKKGHGASDIAKNDFFKQQKDAKKLNELTFTFDTPADSKNDGLWEVVSDAVAKMNISKRKSDRRRKDFQYKTGVEKEIADAFRNKILNSPDLNNPQIKEFILNAIRSLKKRIKIVDDRQKIFQNGEYVENPNYGKVVFFDNFPGTPEEFLNSPNIYSYANYAGFKSESVKTKINDVYNSLISDTYKALKNNFLRNKGFIKLIEAIYKPKETAKNYLMKQDTRTQELASLSDKLSRLSGVEIRLEQKNSRTNEIQNYLKEINNNIFKNTI